jgi:hypothetical protein
MSNESLLREEAREAIHLGKLPWRQPDRLWGGHGVGAVCALCRRIVARDQFDVAVEFARNGPAPGLDKYHLHLRCFAAWEFEREQPRGSSKQFHTFLNSLPTHGGYCLECLSQMYNEPATVISAYLSESGIAGRRDRCGNCGGHRAIFRSALSS